MMEPSNTDIQSCPESVQEYISYLESENISLQSSREQLETVADHIADVMEKENVENFTANYFDRNGKGFELICSFADKKPVTQVLDELNAKVSKLKEDLYNESCRAENARTELFDTQLKLGNALKYFNALAEIVDLPHSSSRPDEISKAIKQHIDSKRASAIFEAINNSPSRLTYALPLVDLGELTAYADSIRGR